MPVSDDIFYTANQSPACPFRDVNTPGAVFNRFFYGVNQEGSVCNTTTIVTFALQDSPKTSQSPCRYGHTGHHSYPSDGLPWVYRKPFLVSHKTSSPLGLHEILSHFMQT